MRFQLEADPAVPVAYIDLVEGRTNSDSKKQYVVELNDLTFVPTELIFDVNEAGNVIGVEII